MEATISGRQLDPVEKGLIYLCSCAVNRRIPSIQNLEEVNTEALYHLADKHMLTSAVGMALESAGIKKECFTTAIAQAQRKNALLDADRALVLAELEKAGIWYMPLKGSVLKELYPRYGMRQMADNDILFDESRRVEVRRIMENLGFTTEHYEQANHDVYYKKPVSNFEMHVYLINGRSNDQLETYYLDVKDRLIKDEGNQYGYHFSVDDFYLFLVAHEYKHYVQGGTGLRSLLDTYVYLKQKGDALNWDYIEMETIKMGVSDFGQLNRKLALNLFDEYPLSEAEQKMLDYILSSGTYGTMENDTNNQIQKNGRLGFFLSRLTLSDEDMKNQYPVLRKAPWLYPLMWVWRLIYKFFTNHGKFMYQLKAALGIVKQKKDE